MNVKVWIIKDPESQQRQLVKKPAHQQQNGTSLEKVRVNPYSIKGRELKLERNVSHSCKHENVSKYFYANGMCWFSVSLSFLKLSFTLHNTISGMPLRVAERE